MTLTGAFYETDGFDRFLRSILLGWSYIFDIGSLYVSVISAIKLIFVRTNQFGL